MFNNRKIRRWARDLVEYIEREAGYKIPNMARESVQKEIETSIRLNGQVSQRYLNNLIKAYKFAVTLQISDPAIQSQTAGSMKSR